MRSRQSFSPFQVFLFLVQRHIAKEWDVSLGEAAFITRFAAEEILSNWDLAVNRGYLLRERRGSQFHVWVTDKRGFAEHLWNPAEKPADSFTWSKEAEVLLKTMLKQGAREIEIVRALLKVDEARIAEWGKDKPRSFWFLELQPIFDVMLENAKTLNLPLPDLRDRDAWVGG